MISAVLVPLVLLGSAPAPEAVGARLASLVAELGLARRGLDPAELCVDAAPPATAPWADLLAVALAEAELPRVARCPHLDGPDRALDTAARDAGYELRLVVRPDDDGLSLELRRVDHGLWAPPELPAVVAWAREARPTPSTSPTPSPPEPGLRLSRVGGVDRPVRALAACDLSGDGVAELVGLTDERVLVWREQAGALVLAGEWSLADQPRAALRVRDPIGGVVCAPMGPGGAPRIAAGHSDMSRGVVLAVRAEGRGLRLERERALPAIPLAWHEGVLYAAEPDQGRNRFGPLLLAHDRAVELARPVLELAAPPPGQRGRLLALDVDHRAVVLGEALALGAVVAASGLGLVQVPSQGRLLLAVSSRLRSGGDSVRLLDLAASTTLGPVSIPGAVVAGAASPSARPAELWLAARVGDTTHLYRLSIAEVRP